MFDIRTPKRVYFLAADSESDMNSWVGCICHVCGLKVFYREDEETGSTMTLTRPSPSRSGIEDTPPTSPTSPTGSSGPYFPLSECLSGSRSALIHESMASINQPSSAPVTPAPTRGFAASMGTQSLRGKPRREDWNLMFYDQPRQLAVAHVFDSHGEQPDLVRGVEEKFARSFKKLLPASQRSAAGERFVPPPRPPKPAHLSSEQPSHNYLNLEQIHAPKTPSRSSSPRSPPSVSPLLPTPSNADSWCV